MSPVVFPETGFWFILSLIGNFLNNELILALDIGSSSVRAALYDSAGTVLPETMVKHERLLNVTDDGGAEINADQAFAQAAEAIDKVLDRASSVKGRISFVAMSAFWHSLVGIDEDGRATTAVLGWADTRSRDCVEQLRLGFDEIAVHNRTGARFHSSFWPAKLLWLQSSRRESFGATRKWISLSDYILLKISGRAITSISMASATGLYDVRECCWDESLAVFAGITVSHLPTVADLGETVSATDEYARRWPRLAESAWFPAIGDGAANNIGAGCVAANRAALMIGTSAAMRVAFRGEVPELIPEGLWCYRIDRERVILGGALSDGGGLYGWMKKNLLTDCSDDEIEAAIANRKPDEHGLTFLPFLAGERGTGYHGDATGAIIGLRNSTESIDIIQSALESVGYRIVEIFDQIRRVCGIETIIASGGALRESPVWTKMICDIIGHPMKLPDTREASSRGAVLLALETVGKIEDISAIETPDGEWFDFDAGRHQIYAAARERHAAIYSLLIRK